MSNDIMMETLRERCENSDISSAQSEAGARPGFYLQEKPTSAP